MLFCCLLRLLSLLSLHKVVWQGKGAILTGRKLLGETDPAKSPAGSIRGDYSIDIGRNIIHGSDGPEGAAHEINFWSANANGRCEDKSSEVERRKRFSETRPTPPLTFAACLRLFPLLRFSLQVQREGDLRVDLGQRSLDLREALKRPCSPFAQPNQLRTSSCTCIALAPCAHLHVPLQSELFSQRAQRLA